ncbi:MAG TPA: gluconokinase [Acidiferrobacterales bacterium]|nr:gluconokinase [Acidiferrobacterales bacterium]
MIVVLMGVSGCGKTTIGQILSEKLGWPLFDADEFHCAASIDKMRNGIPLEDADRWPWLDRMNAMLREREARGESVLLACSALKQAYRDRLSKGTAEIRWIYLKGQFELIRERLEARKGHYMKAGLLESQFAALEEPENALSVDIDESPNSIADSILRRLQALPARKTGSDK